MRLLTNVTVTILGMSFALSTARAEETSIYFATGSSALPSAAVVKKLAKRAGQGATYHVSGYTDPRGSDEINNRLRAERADAAKRALIAAGVDESQITVEDGAIGSENNPKSFAKQRRVAIRFEGGHRTPPVATADPVPDEPPTKVKPTKPVAPEKPEKPEKPVEHVEATRPTKPEKPEKPVEHVEATRPTKPDPTPTEPTEPKSKPPVVATKPTTPNKSLEPIRLIYWRALNHALWIIAKEKGFFEMEGFDVTLEETDANARKIAESVKSGSTIAEGVLSAKALQKGQTRYTAGAVCGYAAHEAMAHGDPIVDIGSMIMIPETLVMKKELSDEIEKNIRAFKDKTIGLLSYGAGVHEFKYNNVLSVQLERAGLRENTDFSFKEYANLDVLFTNLASDKIQIAKLQPPADVEFVRKHPEYTRVPFAKFFPFLPCCRQLVTRSQLKENRPKYVRLLRASIRAHQYTIQHPRESAAILAKYLGISPSVVRQSIMSSYVTLTPDPMRKGIELYQRTNDRQTNTKTSTAEFVDTSLYRDALFGLAKENALPDDKGYYDTMLSRFRANN